MKIGTRSFCFGAHAFWLHGWCVWFAWIELFGWKSAFDPRIMIACFIHDIGYIGKPGMDCPAGKEHPELGGRIMGWLFGYPWCEFTKRHSRGYCKPRKLEPSRLCYADKLAICYIPYWIYIPMAWLTGELNEYRSNWKPYLSAREWIFKLRKSEKEWVNAQLNSRSADFDNLSQISLSSKENSQ